MTANQDGWDPLPLPTDRPILARTVDGEDIPIRHSEDEPHIWIHVDGDWSGFWREASFTKWKELPDVIHNEANDD